MDVALWYMLLPCHPVTLYCSATAERSVDSNSSGNQGVIIGLSIALGVTLAVIAGLAAYKFRVKKNARRLMEDMGDGDL